MTLAKRIVKKALVSFSVSAGVLSIANVETIWREQQHRGDYATVKNEAKARLTEKLERALPKSAPKIRGAALSLRDALGGVELGEVNPFEHVSNLNPLNELLAKGVLNFKRQAYRSSNYKEESGYDLVEFQITHLDHTNSTILAYLERTLEGPDLVPVILLVTNAADSARQTLYRGGVVIENQTVLPSVAMTKVNQRLNAGVPFMSVSR